MSALRVYRCYRCPWLLPWPFSPQNRPGCYLQEAPRLHSSSSLPVAARAIVSMGVRLLNCTYCGFYDVKGLARGFAERDRVLTHHYAAVRGTQRQ